MMNFIKNTPYYLLLATFILASTIFFIIIYREIPTDLQEHIIFLVKSLDKQTFPAPPLYYWCIYLFSGFSSDIQTLNYTAVVFLGGCVAAKYWVSYTSMREIMRSNNYLLDETLLAFIVFSMLFTVPIFYNWVYKRMMVGRLPINVWHNSTIILVLPFSILLYSYSLRYISHIYNNWRDIAIILVLGILNILTKPSFLFAFIPVFPLMVLAQKGWRRDFWLSLLISIVLFGALLLEYYIIYILENEDIKEKTSVIIAPFEVWSYWSTNLPLDILVSILFPITVTLLFWKEVIQSDYIRYAAFLFLIAAFVGATFMETGSRAYHGNFNWQVIITNYILFLVFSLFAAHKIKLLGLKNFKSVIMILVYLAHLGSGFIYLLKILYHKSFH